jgi:predicted Zn-dependent protease
MTQSHDANLPIPCQLRLKEIESNLHHAWKLEKKLPHVLNALVSADPKSYQDTLSKMATLDNKNPEADADGTAETDLPCKSLALQLATADVLVAQRNIDQVIFIDNIPTKAKGDRELAVALKIINGKSWSELH